MFRQLPVLHFTFRADHVAEWSYFILVLLYIFSTDSLVFF